MELGHVPAFLMGFAIATAFYFIISGLAWIERMHGMDREDSLALVECTNGKYLSQIMEKDHMRIPETAVQPKLIADKERDPTHTATEMARLSRKLISLYIAAECNDMKKPYMH
jgi:hypothetical protein